MSVEFFERQASQERSLWKVYKSQCLPTTLLQNWANCEQLKFGPITRSLLNMWYYSGQGSQRTTRVMLVLSVWFLTSYYVQNSYLLQCSLGYSTSFLEVFERAILSFFCIRSSTSMADGKVCFKRDSWQIWFRTEDFSI